MFDNEDDAPKGYTYEGEPGDVVYEQERSMRSTGMRAATVLTTGALIIAGLAGGAAFAFTNASADPGISDTPSASAPADPAATVTDPSASATPTDSPTPTDTSSAAPAPSSSATTGQTIAVPPVTFNNGGDGKREYHDGNGDDHKKPRPTTSPSASPSASASLPSFGGSGDDNSDDNSSEDSGGDD